MCEFILKQSITMFMFPKWTGKLFYQLFAHFTYFCTFMFLSNIAHKFWELSRTLRGSRTNWFTGCKLCECECNYILSSNRVKHLSLCYHAMDWKTDMFNIFNDTRRSSIEFLCLHNTPIGRTKNYIISIWLQYYFVVTV